MSIFENDEEDNKVRSYFEGAMRLKNPVRPIEFDIKKRKYKDAALHMFWLGFVSSMKFHGIKPKDRKWGGSDPYQKMVKGEKPYLKLVE